MQYVSESDYNDNELCDMGHEWHDGGGHHSAVEVYFVMLARCPGAWTFFPSPASFLARFKTASSIYTVVCKSLRLPLALLF